MQEIQVKNVRSLKDTGKIKLSPITLLVGENSSGKSTFLRIFPLLKQSIRKHTDGPLLWAGDTDDYVDFGSFQETVINDGSEDVTFSFSFSTDFTDLSSSRQFLRLAIWGDNAVNIRGDFSEQPDRDAHIVYTLTIAQDKNRRREYISKLRLQLNDTRVEFELNKRGTAKIAVVDEKYTFSLKATEKMNHKEGFSFYRHDILDYVLNESSYTSDVFGFTLPSFPSSFDVKTLLEFYLDKIKLSESPYAFPDISIFLRQIGQDLCKGLAWKEIQSFYKSSSKTRRNSSYSRMIQSISQKLDSLEPEQREKMFAILKLTFIYEYFPQADKYLNTYFRQVHYIAPLRATAERYYRLRNLSVDEVDYQGKNLALFLASLPGNQLKNFQDWTREYFGFYVKTEPASGHMSVKIALSTTKNAEETPIFINVSDTGFGYSQILPVITQLWYLSSRRRGNRNINAKIPLVIAIEQPELHLHPGLQAKLTKAFIAAIQLAEKNGYQLQLLLETHSETIVNCLGRAIAEGNLSHEDISVVLFEREIGKKSTTVRVSGYDEYGYLKDWPIGFFSPKE